MIRVGVPQKYKPTKSSELPKPRKLYPRKLPTIQYATLTMIPLGLCKRTCSHHTHPACQPSTHLANQMRILMVACKQQNWSTVYSYEKTASKV